jgi:hypothetical protein
MVCGLDSFGARWGAVADSCEHGNELLGSVRRWGAGRS